MAEETKVRRRGKPNDLSIVRRSLMWKLDITQADLAARWKVSQSFVSQLLSGKVRSRHFEGQFAQLVQRPREKLFPATPEALDTAI